MVREADDFESWIDFTAIGGSRRQALDASDFVSEMLDFGEPSPVSTELNQFPTPSSTPLQSFAYQSSFPAILPSLVALLERILEELKQDAFRLLSLNPSRREAIASHLDSLAGVAGSVPANALARGRLREWLENPRNQSQEMALETYFTEVALIALGQALVLKNWSDHGIKKWNELDLGRLNWAVSTALKPWIPLDREGWQITRPNLYSWYSFGAKLQSEVWTTLGGWKLVSEEASFLSTLVKFVRKSQAQESSIGMQCGYDPRFLESLWILTERPQGSPLASAQFGSPQTSQYNTPYSSPFTPQFTTPFKRQKVAFSPTLRDGGLVRSGPSDFQWTGLEASPFQLMMAELMHMWKAPELPPHWAIGSGLEVYAKDQLALSWSAAKPSVLCKIAEMEACDVAFVLEEQMVRSSGKQGACLRLKEQLESYPHLKALKSPGTTLGGFQACVALSKLRPGGYLWWAREEPLSTKEGVSLLNFLLDRAKLLKEWDFSDLTHNLPSTLPIVPRHLYLFEKEPKLEARLTHRPVRHVIQGSLRSHIELPLFLEDIFRDDRENRGPWSLLSHVSPIPQKDWLEKWPDPTCHTVVRHVDELRAHSLPIAQFATVRMTPEPLGEEGWSVPSNLKGFWLSSDSSQEERRLSIQALPQPGEFAKGSGYLILVPQETWIPTLRSYLQTSHVRDWLDCQAERKSGRWILNEQTVKWIPLPHSLLQALEMSSPDASVEKTELPNELRTSLSFLPEDFAKLKEALQRGVDIQAQAQLFDLAARKIEELKSSHPALFSLVSLDGKISWKKLAAALPLQERIPLTLHPQLKLIGSLPPHLPVDRIEKNKNNRGILLCTESGFTLQMSSEIPLLMTLLWDQLQGIHHPTWHELLNYLIVPRKLEYAESTALDILRLHSEVMVKIQRFEELLALLKLF